jgi:hypothetical protein
MDSSALFRGSYDGFFSFNFTASNVSPELIYNKLTANQKAKLDSKKVMACTLYTPTSGGMQYFNGVRVPGAASTLDADSTGTDINANQKPPEWIGIVDPQWNIWLQGKSGVVTVHGVFYYVEQNNF